MDHYFVAVKVKAEDEFIVHKEGCMYLPKVTERNYLGLYLTAKEAVKDANLIFQNAKACIHCLKEVYANLSVDFE